MNDNSWNYDPPDSKYVKWYQVEAQFNWKKRSFKRIRYAKWISSRKIWMGYNNKVLNVIRWRLEDK